MTDHLSDIEAFLSAITPEAKAGEARALDRIFREETGFAPRLWGNIIGYGCYDYTYESGRSGRSLATGFAPRARGFSVYIMPGYAAFPEIMARLGKVKQGRACMTFTRLSAISDDALRELIRAGLVDLAKRWRITPT